MFGIAIHFFAVDSLHFLLFYFLSGYGSSPSPTQPQTPSLPPKGKRSNLQTNKKKAWLCVDV